MFKLAEETKKLSKHQRATVLKFIKNPGRVEDDLKPLKTIAGIAKLGEVLAGDSKKSKNDWKTRILKAGLEGRGLIIPEDWDKLNEAEKEKRLNGAIASLA